MEKRMKLSECVLPFIPDHILYEIFVRLPVKSLLQFRRLSKTWRNIIDGLAFANTKLSTRAGFADEDNQILYLPTVGKPPYPLHLLTLHDGDVIRGFDCTVLQFEISIYESNLICFTAYGLFCFHTRGEVGRAYLCNPLRGEVLELPQSKAGKLYGMGFDSTTNTYKIVRVSRRTEIYTLGTQSWREISSVPSYASLDELSSGVSAYGDMHWVDDDLGYLNKDDEKCVIITSFDFKKEEFKQTFFTEFGHKSSDLRFKMINLRGRLSFVILSLENIEIWMLKDYEKKEWVKEYDINHSCGLPTKEICLFVNAWGHGIIFYAYCSANPSVFLDLSTSRILKLQLPERKDFNKTIYGYTGSTLSLKHFGNLVVAPEDRRCNFLKSAHLVYLRP